MNGLQSLITKFEEQVSHDNLNSQSGMVFTPPSIIKFMVSQALLKPFIFDKIHSKCIFDREITLKELKQILDEVPSLKRDLMKEIKHVKILDPACGSGRFLLHVADVLFKIQEMLDFTGEAFELKKNIIENNIFGIEMDPFARFVSELNLIQWLYQKHQNSIPVKKLFFNELDLDKREDFLDQIGIKHNISIGDFLLDEIITNQFDLIIGNPPYVENKKLKNGKYKKQLREKFYSAYKLYDLSILFIERSLKYMKDKTGLLCYVMPNKFLAADYGIKIRELILKESKIERIFNISTIPLFRGKSIYPIIILLNKRKGGDLHEIIVQEYHYEQEIKEKRPKIVQKFPQVTIKKFPSHVIPIHGNISLVHFLYSRFKTLESTFEDLKIIYRPYGFLNWAQYLNEIDETVSSSSVGIPNDKRKNGNRDFLFVLGTGNVNKYHIDLYKPIKIARKNLKVSAFYHDSACSNIHKKLCTKKLIFREIARELTCAFDLDGMYTNITGLYFLIIPSFTVEQYYWLETIMNSNLMDHVFKTLFGTLHMAGNFLRFNGSFLKRLIVPDEYHPILSQLGKILQFLSQLNHDIKHGNKHVYWLNSTREKKLEDCLKILNVLTNGLVNYFFLKDIYSKKSKEYHILEKFISQPNYFLNLPLNYISFNKDDLLEPSLQNEIKKKIDMFIQNLEKLKENGYLWKNFHYLNRFITHSFISHDS
ncbi:MAG: HsdM family class I SAM-dependent methyltransferase [Promethearchaeota archaeon]